MVAATFWTGSSARAPWGWVWRGRDRESGTVYAIKLLRPDLLGDPVLVGRFVRERTALMAIRHPKTVAVHDMVVEGDRLALIMDFVSGEDLRAYRLRRGGSLPPAEAAWLVAQICEALAATHAAGIVHRDLKPANVLLDGTRPNAPVRLADFGIARILDEASVTSAETILGTPSYLSPEVVKGEQPGPACDVYAVGITLYELIAGSVPFQGSPAAVFQQHLSSPPRPDPRIPRELWAIITRCLAKTPA
ncbi:MAG: serine/threonine-protein kinase [Actinoallomurus sp.]